jgi:3-deoxy-manno-octulosonate cytidylyltransferase (CMP-KDO synthetase)
MVTVVIPARMGSSRYPGKPMINIGGIPMIEYVRRRALLATGVSAVVVATCDEVIRRAIEGFGGDAIMTSSDHERCTDRVEEAMRFIDDEIVVMVQGDEPLLDPLSINQVSEPLILDKEISVTNLLSPLSGNLDLKNPNIVKAVCNQQNNIIYFSRQNIPYMRSQIDVPVFRQTGIMAFRKSFLSKYSQLSETPLEMAESIDMLRVLENEIPIRGVVVDYQTYGVDIPSDLALIERLLKENPRQYYLNSQLNINI